MTITILDQTGTSITAINHQTQQPYLTICVENTTLLTRNAKVKVVMPNGANAELLFKRNGANEDHWEPEFLSIPAGGKVNLTCHLARKGGTNHNEQIKDTLYYQYGGPGWQPDTTYQPILLTVSVS